MNYNISPEEHKTIMNLIRSLDKEAAEWERRYRLLLIRYNEMFNNVGEELKND